MDELKSYICVVCGNPYDLHESFVCDHCEWEVDLVQADDPDYRGGANPDSLNERKKWWEEVKKPQLLQEGKLLKSA